MSEGEQTVERTESLKVCDVCLVDAVPLEHRA